MGEHQNYAHMRMVRRRTNNFDASGLTELIESRHINYGSPTRPRDPHCSFFSRNGPLQYEASDFKRPHSTIFRIKKTHLSPPGLLTSLARLQQYCTSVSLLPARAKILFDAHGLLKTLPSPFESYLQLVEQTTASNF